MGSAAAYQLASRGLRVLGLDAFERGHARGSSHGSSRAIRKAYFQAPDYVPLVERAYTSWQQLEAESDEALLRVTGSLLLGSPESEFIAGTISSATRFGLPFEVVAPTRPEHYAPESCPTYAMALPEGEYYGMPDHGLKIGRHDVGEVCTPDTVRRGVDAAEIAMFMAVLERYLPGAHGQVTATLTCLYTMTPDKHSVVDKHPHDPRVVYACGFSGHGFKFAPVIGEVLADLAVDGRTNQPVAFLSAARFTQVGA